MEKIKVQNAKIAQEGKERITKLQEETKQKEIENNKEIEQMKLKGKEKEDEFKLKMTQIQSDTQTQLKEYDVKKEEIAQKTNESITKIKEENNYKIQNVNANKEVKLKELDGQIQEKTEEIKFRAKLLEETKDLDNNQKWQIFNKMLDNKNGTPAQPNTQTIYPNPNPAYPNPVNPYPMSGYAGYAQTYCPYPQYPQPQSMVNPYMPPGYQMYSSPQANPYMMVTPPGPTGQMNSQYMYPPGGNPNPNAFAPQNMMYAKPVDNNTIVNPQSVPQPQQIYYQKDPNNNDQDNMSRSYQGPPVRVS